MWINLFLQCCLIVFCSALLVPRLRLAGLKEMTVKLIFFLMGNSFGYHTRTVTL